MARGCTFGVRVRGEAILGLRHAGRELAVTAGLQVCELPCHAGVEGDVLGAVDFLGNGADLLFKLHVVRIEWFELGLAVIRQPHGVLSQLLCAGTAIGPM